MVVRPTRLGESREIRSERRDPLEVEGARERPQPRLRVDVVASALRRGTRRLPLCRLSRLRRLCSSELETLDNQKEYEWFIDEILCGCEGGITCTASTVLSTDPGNDRGVAQGEHNSVLSEQCTLHAWPKVPSPLGASVETSVAVGLLSGCRRAMVPQSYN